VKKPLLHAIILTTRKTVWMLPGMALLIRAMGTKTLTRSLSEWPSNFVSFKRPAKARLLRRLKKNSRRRWLRNHLLSHQTRLEPKSQKGQFPSTRVITLTVMMMRKGVSLASNVKNQNASFFKAKLPSCKKSMRLWTSTMTAS
jgi:hypothetical protein